MSSSVTTDTDSPAAGTSEQETPAIDGWRSGGLTALRAELDRIDDTIHDLLMQRAQVVEHVARSGKPTAFRPGREASIVRRLLGRHRGNLPAVSLFRIWREVLAGGTAMQGGFSLAVCDTDTGAPLTQLAREHFGALTPLRMYQSPGQALVDVSQGTAAVAILPYPSDGDSWWVALLRHEPRLHVIGHLPFWKNRPEGTTGAKALVVAAAPPDPSGQDRSLLGLECDSDVSRTRLSSELTAAGLKPETMVLLRGQGSAVAHVLVDVDGYLTDDDARLSHLGSVLRQPIVVGGYAVPVGGR